MARFEKKFGKYIAAVDNDMGDDATGCWIEYKSFSASLECADGTGVLENFNGGEHKIEQAIIDEIREWAEENGY